MDGVNKPLVVKDLQHNDTRVLQPNSGNHFFKGSKMLEIPINNTKDKMSENMNYRVKPWSGFFKEEVRTMRNGGWLFNELNGDGKLLPFLKKQEGGMTETREETIGQDYGASDAEPIKSVNFNDRVHELIETDKFQNAPPSIQSELEFFRSNPEHQDKLTESYIKKYIPSLYQYLTASDKVRTPNTTNTEPSRPGTTARIEDFETREDPKFQYGGYTSFHDYANAKHQQVQPQANQTPKYETGTRIMYRSGGPIKEGVVKHYDPITGEITVY